MSEAKPSQIRRKLNWHAGILTDLLSPMTYRVALYLLLAFPMGMIVLGLLLAGAVMGVLLLPFLIGAPLLIVTLWLVGSLAEIQRVFARLLGLSFAPPQLTRAYSSILPWLRATLMDSDTYKALLFHIAQFPLALLCWLALLFTLGLSLISIVIITAQDLSEFVDIQFFSYTFVPSPYTTFCMFLMCFGGLLLSGGVLNLVGRVWTNLCRALLSRDERNEAARREVMALRQAAGRVALSNDLQETLHDLMSQAQLASTARTVGMVDDAGKVRALSGPDSINDPLPQEIVPNETVVTEHALGYGLAIIPVTQPNSSLKAGTIRAVYTHGLRPGQDELAFLLSIADHVGTALRAEQLIERASTRASEQERARLARELHDSVAQALYGISLGAKTARATLDRDIEKTRASLDYTINLAEGGVSEMKALLFSLRPDALEEGGLIAALAQHAHALEARHGLKVQASLLKEPPLSSDAQAAAYRIMQEALHNVVKHARAQQVWLSVIHHQEYTEFLVRDDGRGFDVKSQGTGTLGQRSMRERSLEVGGKLNVDSVEGEGTVVTLQLPNVQEENLEEYRDGKAQ